LGNLMAIGIQRPSFQLARGAGMKAVKAPAPPGAVAQAKELAGTEPDSVLGNKAGDT
jgi:hypothetical protein